MSEDGQKRADIRFKGGFPRLFRAHRVLLDLAQLCCKQAAADCPDENLNGAAAVIFAFILFVKGGIAVRCTDPDGNITWKATPKFLRGKGADAETLVTIGPFETTH